MQGRPLQPGSPAAAIVAEEERLLAQVVGRAAAALAAGDGARPADYDQELIALRDQVAEAKPEDVGPLVEQMMRAQALAAQRGRSRALPVDPASPYFAHIRLREGARERDVLIGKRAFIDRGRGVQIVDWRNAPVSRIYYRYDEGDDYDEPFEGGRLEGLVTVRRNLTIVGGRLRRIGCPLGTFVRDARGEWFEAEGLALPVLQGGQGTAARPPRPAPRPTHAPSGAPARARRGGALGVHGGAVPRADKHLPEIAALIDRDQFDLITQPDSGLVVIQGGAGSGKTTVALHRVAYLAYQDPDRFRPSRMLVIVPTVGLARYVEGVLPALGVSGVAVQTYRAWAAAARRRLVPEAGARYTDETPEAVSRVKKHPAVLALLEERVAAQAGELEAMLPEELRARWRLLGGLPLVRRCRRLRRWLEDEGTDLPSAVRLAADGALRRARRRAGDVVRDFEELLTDAGALRDAFRRHARGEPVRDRDLEETVARVVRQKSEPPEERYAGVDPDRLVPVDGGPLDGGPDDEIAEGRLDVEDDALLLRLYGLKHGGLVERRGPGGEPRELRYEHVVVDEAQDHAAVELKVLLEATAPRRSVTVAGDPAQRLVFDNSFTGFPALLEDAGQTASQVHTLRLSYRSTAEVMRLARAVLGPLADPDEPLVARPGAPVQLHAFAEMGEAVAFLADALRSLVAREPTASVALLARYPEQADAYLSALVAAEVPGLRRVRRQEFTFAPGVDVTDVSQVKGLEYDYVIAVEVSAVSYPDAVEARHVLHIAATRAAHQLWLVTTEAPSTLLPRELLDTGYLG